MKAAIDHLVVAAATLAEGVAWCERTLGVTPGPGGEHPLMGTHNRLLRIATPEHPRAYFEIIAAQPGRTPQRERRWFDLDDDAVRERLRRDGPRLLHFVVRVDDLDAALRAWQALGIDRGEPVAASRDAPAGLLRWRIALRADGQRLFQGGLPTLIEWGDRHACDAMPESGVTLRGLCVTHPRAALLARACEAIGLGGLEVRPGPADVQAQLDTPAGPVHLHSGGL